MRDNDNDNTTTTPKPENSLRFGSRGKDVYNNLQTWVCRAKSNTYAIRIARALNQYQPDRRGQ